MVAKCIVAGADLGDWRVPNGWAVACVYLSYDYTRAEQRAKSARRGIWARQFELPWEWRRQQRRNTEATDSRAPSELTP